jgi:hypothetical protein
MQTGRTHKIYANKGISEKNGQIFLTILKKKRPYRAEILIKALWCKGSVNDVSNMLRLQRRKGAFAYAD